MSEESKLINTLEAFQMEMRETLEDIECDIQDIQDDLIDLSEKVENIEKKVGAN